jgi:fused signal recognition particle receptor
MINAASDTVIGLAVGIPVVVVAGGVTLAVRLRRRGGVPGSDTLAPEKTSTSAPAAPPVAEATAGADVATTIAPVEAEPAEPVDVVVEPVEVAEPATYRSRMGKARGLLSGYLGSVRAKSKIDASTWDDLEEALIRADVGVGATDSLLDDLRARVKSGEIAGADALIDALKGDLVATLSTADAGLAVPSAGSDMSDTDESDGSNDSDNERSVDVWLFVGVNGVGKTTTVGKVASRLSAEGKRVLLAAADTFRAAAAEQLDTWATRSDADIVRGSEGGDPSSVVFDAVQRAASKGHAVVLADTAGRLHNKVNLVEELKKIRRVADRPPGRVVEVLLVLDATTGQNGLAQAKVFTEAVDVTGVVLTKLDGTAKGGIVVAIQRELGLPVKLVGLGEGVGDLIDFDAAAFVDALF